ncbi:hypothetical protein ACLOJK_011927 [Asimina triloba]
MEEKDRHRRDESLWSYMTRFIDATLNVENMDNELAYEALPRPSSYDAEEMIPTTKVTLLE